MKISLLALFLIFQFTCDIFAQGSEVAGTVKSTTDQLGLPGATVMLEKHSETSTETLDGTVTDVEGNFQFENVSPGSYTISVQFIGFARREIDIEVVAEPLRLDDILLDEESTTLDELVVVGQVAAGQQKADTSEFNAAAFKTARDASSQDLVEKIPGIELVDGRIQAQGENVEQILIDGKPFFGTDVNAALQSLPADAVASIQVFDQLSDKAILSGFDDGERTRTINIITKQNRKKGTFGKATIGYGTDDRYMAAASLNFFNGDRRITTTGLSNNVNTLNFSADPTNEGESRPENGIIQTHSGGINFIDTWKGNIDFTGSYFYTNRENQRRLFTVRDYVSSDSGQIYTEDNINTNITSEHRADIRFDYKIDDRNRLIIRPSISLRDNRHSTFFTGNTNTDNRPLNETENESRSDNNDNDYHSRISYGHQFLKHGRSITLRLHNSYHGNVDDAYRLATNVFFDDEQNVELLNQYTNLARTGMSWEAGVSYTEPLSKYAQLEIEYEIGNRLNDSDKRVFDYEDETGGYSQLNTAISNTFKSEYLTQETELGYQYKKEKLILQAELEYQHAQLQNDQVFPETLSLNRTFQSLLPSARLEYKFSNNANFQFNYRTWTNEPNVSQLQNVIDNQNPLQLRTGNPNLDQSYNSWLRGQYRFNNPESGKSFYASLQGNFTRDYIANSTFIAETPTPINDDITLETGSQLTRPVNVDGYMNLRSYFNYSRRWNLISSNISFSGGARYSRQPGVINDETNIAETRNIRGRIGISSNISPNVDFNITTQSSYSVVENTLRPALNNDFFNQSSRLRLNWVIWEGFVFRTDLNHQVNRGLSAGVNTNFALWNMSIGKKIFRNQLGEVSLMVYDLLKQNNNIRRNVNEVYIEDVRSNVLQQYFMVTFTYNIRHFTGGAKLEDFLPPGERVGDREIDN